MKPLWFLNGVEMVYGILKRIKEGPHRPITEFYTLTHPFYRSSYDYNPDNYFNLWTDSLTKAAKREGVFAILYFCDSLYKDYLINLDTKLVKHAQRMFGKHRMLIRRSTGIGKANVFDEKIKARLANRKTTKVTGRGSNAFQCAHGVVDATLGVYNIPFENGYIDFLESTDTNRDILGGYHHRELFPSIEERERKRKELGEKQYQKWITQKVAQFESYISFDGWWEYNFGLIRIKTYLRDQEHLNGKYGNLKLENLKEKDFDDWEKAKRIAITYQFLIDPLRFYGIPKQLSTDRFHIDPSWQNPDEPKPWEADRSQVFQFHSDLAEFLLGKQVTNDDIDTLTSIVDRATEKNRVVMSVD